MKNALLIPMLLIFCAGASHANAATKTVPKAVAKAVTKKEAPTLEILGVHVGAPLQIKECELKRNELGRSYSYEPYSTKPCFQQPGYEPKADFVVDPHKAILSLEAKTPPPGVTGYDITVLNGSLEKVSIFTMGVRSQEELLAILQEKYGKPSDLQREPMQNRMGANFTRIIAIWDFTNLEVVLVGMGSKIDSGIITVSTPIALQFEKDEEANRPKPQL